MVFGLGRLGGAKGKFENFDDSESVWSSDTGTKPTNGALGQDLLNLDGAAKQEESPRSIVSEDVKETRASPRRHKKTSSSSRLPSVTDESSTSSSDDGARLTLRREKDSDSSSVSSSDTESSGSSCKSALQLVLSSSGQVGTAGRSKSISSQFTIPQSKGGGEQDSDILLFEASVAGEGFAVDSPVRGDRKELDKLQKTWDESRKSALASTPSTEECVTTWTRSAPSGGAPKAPKKPTSILRGKQKRIRSKPKKQPSGKKESAATQPPADPVESFTWSRQPPPSKPATNRPTGATSSTRRRRQSPHHGRSEKSAHRTEPSTKRTFRRSRRSSITSSQHAGEQSTNRPRSTKSLDNPPDDAKPKRSKSKPKKAKSQLCLSPEPRIRPKIAVSHSTMAIASPGKLTEKKQHENCRSPAKLRKFRRGKSKIEAPPLSVVELDETSPNPGKSGRSRQAGSEAHASESASKPVDAPMIPSKLEYNVDLNRSSPVKKRRGSGILVLPSKEDLPTLDMLEGIVGSAPGKSGGRQRRQSLHFTPTQKNAQTAAKMPKRHSLQMGSEFSTPSDGAAAVVNLDGEQERIRRATAGDSYNRVMKMLDSDGRKSPYKSDGEQSSSGPRSRQRRSSTVEGIKKKIQKDKDREQERKEHGETDRPKTPNRRRLTQKQVTKLVGRKRSGTPTRKIKVIVRSSSNVSK